jgi:hypothetical protein
MIKIFLTFILLLSLHAKENFSEMSTQELIAIIGYVDSSDKSDFDKELSKRVSSMTDEQKRLYYSYIKR